MASEGIEVVRMMRDTNWLEGDDKGAGSDLDLNCGSGSGQNDAAENIMNGKACYPDWLNGVSGSGYHNYNIGASGNAGDFRLIYTPPDGWNLDRRNGSQRFHLCLQATGTYQHNATCDAEVNPPFARRVAITSASTSAPYTPLNPELRIRSAVIWSGRNCPSIVNVDPISSTSRCKVMIEEHMTNWKDYD